MAPLQASDGGVPGHRIWGETGAVHPLQPLGTGRLQRMSGPHPNRLAGQWRAGGVGGACRLWLRELWEGSREGGRECVCV